MEREVLTVEDPGSDFMVDVLKTLDFEYIAANPASSFRGLHESFITHGSNKAPEWLTCCHEEAAVNIANGYYAVAGKPMAVITFAPSGLQHATMGIFGAFSGHSPTYILCSNIVDGKERRPQYDWGMHSVVDPAAMVRDMVKWDDTPGSLQHFAESAVRAYKMAMTEPRGPSCSSSIRRFRRTSLVIDPRPHPQADTHQCAGGTGWLRQRSHHRRNR